MGRRSLLKENKVMITDLTLIEPGEALVIPKGKVALLFHIPGHCAGCKRVISIFY